MFNISDELKKIQWKDILFENFTYALSVEMDILLLYCKYFIFAVNKRKSYLKFFILYLY